MTDIVNEVVENQEQINAELLALAVAAKAKANEKEEDDSNLSVMDRMRKLALKESLKNLEDGLNSFAEDSDDREKQSVSDNFFKGVIEDNDNLEVLEEDENIENEEDNTSNQETEIQKQLKLEKEEIIQLKLEAELLKKQSESDQALMLKAMQIIESQTASMNKEVKQEVKQEEVVVESNLEDIKKKSKSFVDKILNAQDDATDDLESIIQELTNKNKQISIEEITKKVSEQVNRQVQESLKNKEIDNYNSNFQKVNNDFFAKNKEFTDNKINYTLFKSNFDSLYKEYTDKGELPNPEGLFSKALEVTKTEIESFTGKKAVQNKEVVISDKLKEEAAKTQEAKSNSPKNQTASKVTNNNGKSVEKFDELDEYRKMLARRGITKF